MRSDRHVIALCEDVTDQVTNEFCGGIALLNRTGSMQLSAGIGLELCFGGDEKTEWVRVRISARRGGVADLMTT